MSRGAGGGGGVGVGAGGGWISPSRANPLAAQIDPVSVFVGPLQIGCLTWSIASLKNDKV